jgi:hypothetical protein
MSRNAYGTLAAIYGNINGDKYLEIFTEYVVLEIEAGWCSNRTMRDPTKRLK